MIYYFTQLETTVNRTLFCGYIGSWACTDTCRQLLSHVEFCVRGIYFFYFFFKATPFFDRIITISIISPRGLSSGSVEYTPCIIADMKITCQNASIPAPRYTRTLAERGPR